jgi:GR25 family glycosyltransferase involved in LPS biosynthesis
MVCINPQTIKIFVIHYKNLVKRKHNIIRQFKTYNITNYEFIEIDRHELTIEDMNLFEGEQRSNKAQMAISLSHYYAYKEIIAKYDNALILEDDIILSNNFTNILNDYLTQLPEDYDMLFIGDGCNLHIEDHAIVPGKYIYEKDLYPTSWGGGGATRCTDSYLVSKKCAIKLCDYIKNLTSKNNIAVDWWLNEAAQNNNLKVYWAEPTIVTQGTQSGLFQSSY